MYGKGKVNHSAHVNNLPRVALDSGAAGIRTCDLPLCHRATCVGKQLQLEWTVYHLLCTAGAWETED